MKNKSKPSRLQRWIVQPIFNQLRQGITAEKLAWSISLGITLGIFPIMGSTSLICFAAGYLLKLNQPILHLFKTLSYPLHLAMILVFIRLGQHLNGEAPIAFSITEMLIQFQENPAQFVRDFSLAAWYGIQAWALSALILIPLIHFISLSLLRKLMKKRASNPSSFVRPKP